MPRLLRGEDLEALSHELGVTAAAFSGRRDPVLAGGKAYLNDRESQSESEETRRPKVLVADLNMSNELPREKIHALEARRPLGWRRGKR